MVAAVVPPLLQDVLPIRANSAGTILSGTSNGGLASTVPGRDIPGAPDAQTGAVAAEKIASSLAPGFVPPPPRSARTSC
ncbi:hypothetical protein ART_0509 [Arthrobacter sp. PAMC 25486]|nr:hypothetical protein ART_0509 [Arthrobacter sp. PAMC 25486]